MGLDYMKLRVLLSLGVSPVLRHIKYYTSSPDRLLNKRVLGVTLILVITSLYLTCLAGRRVNISITIGKSSKQSSRPLQSPVPVQWLPAHTDNEHRASVYFEDHDPTGDVYNQEEEKSLIERFQFNKYKSDRIPLNRAVRDNRHDTCLERRYPSDMPSSSVVMVFYNEPAAVVLRTVHSVLNKSPEHLIYEILLYDDNSDLEELLAGSWFTKHIKTLPKVRLERSTHGRGGLIQAKTHAGRLARGEVLVYLDAHCECNNGWLEPLIYPIYLNKTACTTPNIDVIAWEDMVIHAPPIMEVTGGLNWVLNMLWSPLSDKEHQRRSKDPWPISSDVRTPTMAGGLFAINRLWFYEIGMYDEGQDIWGGENIDLSFRVWLCGGAQWMSPCSKVSHIFRPKHPYSFGTDNGDVVLKNYKRNALVWLDGPHLDFFYKWKPQARNVDAGDVSSRLALKEKLQCRSFDYFLEEVWPELPAEKDCLATGAFSTDENACMDNAGGSDKHGQSVEVWGCHNLGNNQFWMYKEDHRIMGMMYVFDIAGTTPGSHVTLVWVNKNNNNQLFDYNEGTRQLKHRVTGLCVDRSTTDNQKYLVINECSDSSTNQRWTFQYTYNKSFKP